MEMILISSSILYLLLLALSISTNTLPFFHSELYRSALLPCFWSWLSLVWNRVTTAPPWPRSLAPLPRLFSFSFSLSPLIPSILSPLWTFCPAHMLPFNTPLCPAHPAGGPATIPPLCPLAPDTPLLSTSPTLQPLLHLARRRFPRLLLTLPPPSSPPLFPPPLSKDQISLNLLDLSTVLLLKSCSEICKPTLIAFAFAFYDDMNLYCPDSICCLTCLCFTIHPCFVVCPCHGALSALML